jgi:hypothetical protein
MAGSQVFLIARNQGATPVSPSSICFCSGCSAPGFLDFQRHRFAERLKGRLDLVEARGVVESEQTIDGFSIPAETAHQLGAGDAALAQRAVAAT